MQELSDILKLLDVLGSRPLTVGIVTVLLVRLMVISPLLGLWRRASQKVAAIETAVGHYLEIHQEDLFTSGRIERLLKAILAELAALRRDRRTDKRSG
jgi:hypothetical protein